MNLPLFLSGRFIPILSAKIKNFDLIHLHWWQGSDLKKLHADNPTARFVFSLHDDIAHTGGVIQLEIVRNFSLAALIA